MKHVLTLLARELGAYFLSPIAYLVLLAFQLIAWLNFWELVESLSQPQREFSSLRDPMNMYISGSVPFWFAILFAVPALTMRLFAEERRTGTIEGLLTIPVTETEIVISKWLAGVVMYLLLLVPFVIYLPFLYHQARFYFDLGPLIGLGIGLTSMGMMFVAIGLFFSVLTRNQILAAIWTFVVLFLMVVLSMLVYYYAARQQSSWAESARFLSAFSQIQAFGFGRIDFRTIALHLSVCVFTLFLTAKILEIHRGR